MIGLTPTLRDLMWVIQELTDAHGYGPNYAELAAEMGYTNRGQVADRLRGLESRGYVHVLRNRARSIAIITRIPMPDWEAAEYALTEAGAAALRSAAE